MEVVLVAVDQALADAWTKYCGHFPYVKVHHGDIFELDCDAMVSPANSYGYMDGGIDWLYSKYFGWGVQKRLQQKIQQEFDGELLVGQATVVPTNHEQVKYIISAPTMRVPIVLPLDTVNPFLAAKAAFLAAKKHGDINVLAMPGLGTGVGEVDPELCAKQVSVALDEVIGENTFFPISWHDALDRHEHLGAGRISWEDDWADH